MGDVLVVGGTGMLAGVVDQLVADGHRVLLPSRHPGEGRPGVVAFAADWSDPSALRDAVTAHLDGALDRVVVWCHHPYRPEVTAVLAPLLESSGSPVVEVWGSTALTDLWDHRPDATSIHVMLGHRQLDDGTSRWLTNDEISAGVIDALQRPAGSTLVIGSLD